MVFPNMIDLVCEEFKLILCSYVLQQNFCVSVCMRNSSDVHLLKMLAIVSKVKRYIAKCTNVKLWQLDYLIKMLIRPTN